MTAPLPEPASFLSGEHGHVAGRLRRPLRSAADRALDAWLVASGTRRSLAALAERTPARDVLIASVRDDPLPSALHSRRHRVAVAAGSAAPLGGGKFQNLNVLLADFAPPDWLVVADDDIALPDGFLDCLIALCEALALDLAQPAQTLASHAAWRFARRRPLSVARETNFVEIGPLTAFSRRAAAELLPFPDLRFGWGLDAHWSAIAAERGWRMAILDALPVRHELRRVATDYPTAEATSEAQQFLAERPYVRAADAGRTLRVHRAVPT